MFNHKMDLLPCIWQLKRTTMEWYDFYCPREPIRALQRKMVSPHWLWLFSKATIKLWPFCWKMIPVAKSACPLYTLQVNYFKNCVLISRKKKMFLFKFLQLKKMTPKQLDFFYKTTIIRMLLPNPDLLHYILQHIMAMKILQHCYFKGMLM